MKQGEEDAKLVKEPKKPTQNYIFQKTKITRRALYIIIGFLIISILGVVVSGISFEV
ncbi:Hypothetical protein I595_1789 [Croceitalea dokdonensis DOKDO 023]|uniref:Uncharacterized protein n=1 Tax=Croceitalea dokdonensis DOKDO 023 TaxID=1300341 RepID=A0A0N8H419_9FLAO|nr:hypothetical protein [Croceitalea dokdonensis]KPM32140.1 Hypothetical protein I595_1789 [Croceitalea dokdonensis DOKDO 023]